ncbi:hypothetical protein A1O3_10451 [Capronia epimyces CBS 606.96]|uniref:NADH:flavin oxidoreductase/NADH oxidase N-terminal domain-containing protein n=1 Tax=Capronia epimyces CBS 606.96 TaxID=1182542 RepID=W9XAM1_9EURO|nr:uncharacterized protein A1O3_10451 [Capronia epimyces CBS 606.96]EXJ77293.1 hypothetical protein A1O3_10451 [Capronia epimyces CBS 606.96]
MDCFYHIGHILNTVARACGDDFIRAKVVSNERRDGYGGSVANRSHLVDTVMKALVDVVGPVRVGLRLSLWRRFQRITMQDLIPAFSDFITKASLLGWRTSTWSNHASRALKATTTTENKNIVIMFGRHFIANPDLVYKIKAGVALSAYRRPTFYVKKSPLGFVDYHSARSTWATSPFPPLLLHERTSHKWDY